MTKDQYLAALRAEDAIDDHASVEREGELTLDPTKVIAQAEATDAPRVSSAGALPGFDGPLGHLLGKAPVPVRRAASRIGQRVNYIGSTVLQDLGGLRPARMEEYIQRSRALGTLAVGDALKALPAYTPTPEEIVSVAEEYGLDDRYYDRLADAQSLDDMTALARAHATRQNRERVLAETLPAAEAFLLRTGVNMLDPVFMAAGAGAGTVMKVGTSATRTGNAMRAGAAAMMSDAPLETIRAVDDPAYGAAGAAASVLASTLVSSGLGALYRGLDRPEFDYVDSVSENVVNGSYFQGSTAGAAQLNPVGRDVAPPPSILDDAPDKAGFNVFGTPLNYLDRSDDELTRGVAARLSWNPNTPGTQELTAFEARRRVYESGLTYVRQAEAAAQDYWKARTPRSRHQVFGGVSTAQKREFMELVSQVHAGVRQSDDPHVNRAVQAFREGYEDTLRYVQDSNYNGPLTKNRERGVAMEQFADIEHDPAYVMRRFERTGFLKVQNALGGSEGVAARLASVIRRSNQEWLQDLSDHFNARPKTPDATGRVRADMSPEFMALRIARAYVNTVEGVLSKVRQDGPELRAVSREDREAVREIVRQEFRDGADFEGDVEDAIDMVLDLIAPARKQAAESPRARPRMRLDLDAELDGDILPMFDWDAESLFTSYRHQLAGYAGLNKAGYRSVADLNRDIAEIEKRSRGQSVKRQNRAAREIEMLRAMRDHIMGVPRNKDHPTYNWVMQQIRRLNVSNLMNNVGFVAMSEVYGAMLTVGPLRFLKTIPAYRSYMKRIKAGDQDAMKDMMALSDHIMGHGTHQLRSRLHGNQSRFDAEESDILNGVPRWGEKIDTFTRKSANLTSRFSGMGAIAEATRMIVSSVEATNWVKAAKAGKMPYEKRRMAALGISEETWGRIQAELQKMDTIESPDTGRKVPAFDLDRWDDSQALDVFINAIDRNARRLVMEGDLGHRALILDKSPFLQLIFQFMSFPLNAYSKHLGFAINTRDFRGAMEASFMALGGAVGVWARTAAQGLAITSEQERKEFFEERLRPREFAKAMVYYSAHASIMPNLADLPLGILQRMGVQYEGVDEDTGEPEMKTVMPIFGNTRNSGLPSDPITGNPTYSRAERLPRVLAAYFQGRKVSRDDVMDTFKLLAPLGNHVGVLAVMNRLLSFLPPEEEEDQGENTDALLQTAA